MWTITDSGRFSLTPKRNYQDRSRPRAHLRHLYGADENTAASVRHLGETWEEHAAFSYRRERSLAVLAEFYAKHAGEVTGRPAGSTPNAAEVGVSSDPSSRAKLAANPPLIGVGGLTWVDLLKSRGGCGPLRERSVWVGNW